MPRDGAREADLPSGQSLGGSDGHRKECGFILAVRGWRVRGPPLTDLKSGITRFNSFTLGAHGCCVKNKLQQDKNKQGDDGIVQPKDYNGKVRVLGGRNEEKLDLRYFGGSAERIC